MIKSFLLLAFIGVSLCAHLSHVIMPFHKRQVDIVKDNLKLWTRYPPCRNNNMQFGFIFFVSGMRNESLASDLLMEFNSTCFKSILVDFAELNHKDDHYLKGSRLMFEMMLSKKLYFGPIQLSHIFYMEPDALPIRPYWLDDINQQIIPPNSPFWMKGSIFRGHMNTILSKLMYNHIHINGNAIYNLEDEKFEKFYFEILRPFIKKNFKKEGAYDTDIYKILLWDNAKYTAELFHKFQFSDFIQNHWHSNYSISKLRENSPNTFLVHGGQALETRMKNSIANKLNFFIIFDDCMEECSFLIDDSIFELGVSDVAIGKTRPSETIRTWNDSELKSIVSGTGDGGTESTSIVSICEGRGALSEIGLAIFDTQGSLCHIIQYADNSNYSRTMHLLTIHPPLRILICSSATENHRSKLYQTLLDIFPLDSLCFLTRADFNDSKGKEVIERLCLPKSLDGIMFGCNKKYYAFSAVSALFYFLEHELNMSFTSRTMKFVLKPSDGTLSLDYHTCKSLELVSNCSDPKNSNCLFGVICQCQSSMGSKINRRHTSVNLVFTYIGRMMRSSILQPLTDVVAINERQEAIHALLEHELEMQDLRDAMKKFPDVDNFISKLVRKENSLDPKSGEDLIHQALTLKNIIRKAKNLEGTLKNIADCSFLSSIIEVLKDDGISILERSIDEVINEDISYSEKTNVQHHQRFYAVKSCNSNSLIEVARRTLKEIQSDIYEYVETWSKQIDLTVEIKYQSKRGYYLSISNSALGDRSLEGICSQYKRGRTEITFTTMDLIKLNGRVKESMIEVLLASQAILEELFETIRGKIEIIYEISSAIANLDFICGLTQWALGSGSICRPEFTGSELTIRQSRHPILESTGRMVANDYFNCTGNSFTVVTGANMSGKSTYSKQLALLSIMAQMGSFIPGEYAAFPVYDRILTRLGSDDELESNASSFKMEMKEVAYILEMLTDSSLIIIDELGRGTGYLEGLSLALTINDSILKSNATVMFVTHFSQLVNYLKLDPKVSLIQLQTEVSSINGDLKFLYRAASGKVEIEDYGIKLAEKCSLPMELMKSAWKSLKAIKRAQGVDSLESQGLKRTLQRRKNIFKTAEKIKFIKDSGNIESETKDELLKKIKEEFEEDLND